MEISSSVTIMMQALALVILAPMKTPYTSLHTQLPESNLVRGYTVRATDLPECDYLRIDIEPKLKSYKGNDTITVIVTNLKSDSAFVSIGMGGYHKEWETFAADVVRFLEGGDRHSDHVSIRGIAADESIKLVVPLASLDPKKMGFKKWCFYLDGYKTSPYLDYNCYWQSESFKIKV